MGRTFLDHFLHQLDSQIGQQILHVGDVSDCLLGGQRAMSWCEVFENPVHQVVDEWFDRLVRLDLHYAPQMTRQTPNGGLELGLIWSSS